MSEPTHSRSGPKLAVAPEGAGTVAPAAAGLTEVGWKEWIALPELGVPRLVAKVDTGAKTCALHAFYVEPFRQEGAQWVRFGLHPLRKSARRVVQCSAPVVDFRKVRDSGGHEEYRYVIATTVVAGELQFECEMTLTKRDTMRYRFLLGRNAIRDRFLVNPARGYALGKPPARRS